MINPLTLHRNILIRHYQFCRKLLETPKELILQGPLKEKLEKKRSVELSYDLESDVKFFIPKIKYILKKTTDSL